MKKEILKSITIVVMLLLIGIAFQPAVSTNELKTKESEPKEYLFETIIDIAKNPDVENFLNQIDKDEINFKVNYRSVFFRILLKNPSLITSVFFKRPTMSYDYLNFAYHQGIEVVKILGEDKSIEIFNSVKKTNPEIINDLTKIINNNEALSLRISKLEIMNNEVKPDEPFAYDPIICAIFCSLTVLSVIAALTFLKIARNVGESSPIYTLLRTMADVSMDIALINAAIADNFDSCDYHA